MSSSLKKATIGYLAWLVFAGSTVPSRAGAAPPVSAESQHAWQQFSGVYPHLAYWNPHGECGTGAVVPWADKLWFLSYAPHFPRGSEDKLYSITPDLTRKTFAESIGGTPANRLIHRETHQLVIGSYVIDATGNVRVIPFEAMPGRTTGTARHLFEPAEKVYYATMEEGVYEVDLRSLKVRELFKDDQTQTPHGKKSPDPSRRVAALPGYHGKGLYSGQGRLIYANNGEPTPAAMKRPDIPSGCLAEWDGKSDGWTVIRRNQFTDVSGPGGLFGNPQPDSDPVWAIGWDHRSLLLMCLDSGIWSAYRLPKASHTYDGAHGWNTEWPRFRDLSRDAGDPEDLVLNMHGMFWRFPRSFSREGSGGIRPRSTYLKVVGDYARWGSHIVFGCDDTAKNEFLNKRRAKGNLKPPGQSHSNLWFQDETIFDRLGPAIGRGAIWYHDKVTAHTPSDPFLLAGFDRRQIALRQEGAGPISVTLQLDDQGTNVWRDWKTVTLMEDPLWITIPPDLSAEWIRLVTDRDTVATAQFHFSNVDPRTTEVAPMFAPPGDGGRDTCQQRGRARARSTTLLVGIRRARVPPRGTTGSCPIL